MVPNQGPVSLSLMWVRSRNGRRSPMVGLRFTKNHTAPADSTLAGPPKTWPVEMGPPPYAAGTRTRASPNTPTAGGLERSRPPCSRSPAGPPWRPPTPNPPSAPATPVHADGPNPGKVARVAPMCKLLMALNTVTETRSLDRRTLCQPPSRPDCHTVAEQLRSEPVLNGSPHDPGRV